MHVPQQNSSRLGEIRNPLPDDPVLFLDYDGTLVNIVTNPEDARPDDELLALLHSVSARFETYIVTGRSLDDILDFLGRDLDIVALHGAILYQKGKETNIVDNFGEYESICDQIYENSLVMKEQFPGLRIYNKHGNVLFHLGLMKEQHKPGLQKLVGRLAAENSLDVYHGKNIVELRIPGINKGVAIKMLAKGRPSIIIGDDSTDEDAFLANPEAITIHVGPGPTSARYTVDNTDDVRSFLSSLLSRS